jgi:hypothetical protein
MIYNPNFISVIMFRFKLNFNELNVLLRCCYLDIG